MFARARLPWVPSRQAPVPSLASSARALASAATATPPALPVSGGGPQVVSFVPVVAAASRFGARNISPCQSPASSLVCFVACGRRSVATATLAARSPRWTTRAYSVAEPRPGSDLRINVGATFVARRIELTGLRETFGAPGRLRSDAASTVITLRGNAAAAAVSNAHDAVAQGTDATADLAAGSHVVVYGYGSVVFYNVPRVEQTAIIRRLLPFCGEPTKFAQSDDIALVINRSLPDSSWARLVQDHVELKSFDGNALRIVSDVLGHSAALHFYEARVDRMLRQFSQLNRAVGHKGALAMDRRALFQTVAANNTILIEVIQKLGLLERSDAAWKFAAYDTLWEVLREEFDIVGRFKTVDFKLTLVQHNTKFFLEVLYNQKSDKLEWIIITLIGIEIVLSLVDIYQTQVTERREQAKQAAELAALNKQRDALVRGVASAPEAIAAAS